MCKSNENVHVNVKCVITPTDYGKTRKRQK
jgi:hypothetical protein